MVCGIFHEKMILTLLTSNCLWNHYTWCIIYNSTFYVR